MNRFFKTTAQLLAAFTFVATATAAPILRDTVTVVSPIVTVGDMFEDAGIFSEHALFRAPAPGTIGQVSLQSIRVASAKIGLENFENSGLSTVSVSRTGLSVDLSTLEELMANDLTAKGVLRSGMSVSAFLNRELDNIFAEDNDHPVTLKNLRYVPGTNRFSARFAIAGRAAPIDISGRLDFSILAPHLIRSMSAGAVLQATDIEMRDLPLQFANNVGVPRLDQLIGRQLQRNRLEGATIRLNDVADAILISRNQIVTMYLKNGPLTLTVKGQALENASQGQTISVLNLMSNTIVRGVAAGAGSVEISATSTSVASL